MATETRSGPTRQVTPARRALSMAVAVVCVAASFLPVFPGVARADGAQPTAPPPPRPTAQPIATPTPPRDGAQPDPIAVAQARSLFEQGLAAADRRDWRTAVDLFTRSLAVRSSPSVAFNLGMALVQLGRHAEAREHLVFARDHSSDASVRTRARAEAARIEGLLGRVELRLAAPLGHAELRLDGRPMTLPAGSAIAYVDAGGHTFAVVRDGRDVDWAAAEVSAGRTVVVSLDPTRSAPPVRTDTIPAAGIQRDLTADDDDGAGDPGDDGYVVRRRPRRTEERSTSVLERWWFWTAIGVVVAAGTTAAVVAASSGGEDPYRGNLGAGTFEIP